MNISFAYSPCPNDTFMFEPIVSGRINTEGLRFQIHLADVEELNKSAFKEEYDITKLSFNAYTKLTEQYQLLNSGSALGRNCGPLLISKNPLNAEEIDEQTKIAIPGVNTTAHFLLSFAFPQISKKKEMLFSDIEKAILDGTVDTGVIIHENRFTYQERGLHKVQDLGEYWEEKTSYPIPLGGIVTRRRFTNDLKQKIDRVIARSVAYALANPKSGQDYIKCHAQEMDIDVMQSHINLYVNDYSANIGKNGKASIQHLFDYQLPNESYTTPLFVEHDPSNDLEHLSDDYWTSRYNNEKTGWDTGQITTPIKEYVDQLKDKSIGILIPGAGNAHEAEYLHKKGFTDITILDFSKKPLENFKKRCPDFPSEKLIHTNFFDHTGQYDLILEQTFFCALDPKFRSDYAAQMKKLLKPKGKLVGLMMNIEFPTMGPPFGGCKQEYIPIFEKHFDSVQIEECKNSIKPRQGIELFITIQ